MSTFEMIAYIIKGIGITFELVPAVIGSTLVLGFLLGILRFAKIPVISQIYDIYVTFMRGIPPLVILMMLFFTANLSSPFLTAFLSLTIYHSAYIAEIVRGGLEAIPKGQMEAGKSLGLGYFTIMVRVFIPQILLQIVPTLCGQYILVVKDTTLVSVVGLQDIMWNASELVSVTYEPIRIYLIIGAIYFILCFIIDLIANRLENTVVKRYQARLKTGR